MRCLIEAEEFGMYKTFDLENVDEIASIGYAAAIRAFEVVIKENKYETLVKAIAARKKGLMRDKSSVWTKRFPTKTLYIDERNGTKKQDGNLSGIPALVWESATISCNEW